MTHSIDAIMKFQIEDIQKFIKSQEGTVANTALSTSAPMTRK
jgi:hypothetical protein